MANGTVVGIDEAKLWSMADALRNNMDAAEYKHVVLGLDGTVQIYSIDVQELIGLARLRVSSYGPLDGCQKYLHVDVDRCPAIPELLNETSGTD